MLDCQLIKKDHLSLLAWHMQHVRLIFTWLFHLSVVPLCVCLCVCMSVIPVSGAMVGLKPSDVPPPLGVKMASAGLAACIADIVTFPLDTAKVRLQVFRRKPVILTFISSSNFKSLLHRLLFRNKTLCVKDDCLISTTNFKSISSKSVSLIHISVSTTWSFIPLSCEVCLSHVYTLWLQIQGEKAAIGGIRYRGVFGTISTMIRTEGPRSLYNGLVAGLQRQLCFASIRIGLYDNVKSFYTGGKDSKW